MTIATAGRPRPERIELVELLPTAEAGAPGPPARSATAESSSTVEHSTSFVVAIFLVIVALYLACASRFFQHVEDAVISYAYARNVAQGYGVVPYPGGERVEGFSNPTWVLLLAGGQLLGFSPFVSSRALGILFAVGELVVAYLLFRDHLRRSDEPATRALLAPALLASMPGFQMWNHMGLENPLFGFLLLTATHLHLHELKAPRRFAWSGVALGGLLLTHPEAPLYAACIFLHKLLSALFRPPVVGTSASGRRRRGVLWCAVVALPFLAYELWRMRYFAWPLPGPYYTKLATRHTPELDALLGDDRGAAYFWRGVWTLHIAPIFVLSVGAFVRPWARGACLLLVAEAGCAAVFAIYTGGDWMQGFRWLHVLVLPLALLAAAALSSLVSWITVRLVRTEIALPDARGAAWVFVGVLFALVALWPALWVGAALADDLPVLGEDIHARLDHTLEFADAFGLDKVTIMDGDQGGLMYYGPPRVHPLDPIGLNDVSTAQNFSSTFHRHFFHEYFFEQHKPMFYRARQTPVSPATTYPEWVDEYTPIPAYTPPPPHAANPTPGGWMRKDIFRVSALPEDLRDAEPRPLACGLVLRGAHILAPVVDATAPARVEVYWQEPDGPEAAAGKSDYFASFTLVDADGKVVAESTRPLLHQVYAPADWRPDEILRDPEGLTAPGPGEYDVTLAVFHALHDGSKDIRTASGISPLPVDHPGKDQQACPFVGRDDRETIAHVTVDGAAAAAKATALEATIAHASLADAAVALGELRLVLGPTAERVRAQKERLSTRVRREELVLGVRLFRDGKDREAAEHLLRARAEEPRNPEVNKPLEQISDRIEREAENQLGRATTRAARCSGFRMLQEAMATYPANAYARREVEEMRPECETVVSDLDFGEVRGDHQVKADDKRRVFPPGRTLGLRIRWRAAGNLGKGTMPLAVRVYTDDGQVEQSRTVPVADAKGEMTFAWPFRTPGRRRFEATLEGRLEASVTVVIQAPKPKS